MSDEIVNVFPQSIMICGEMYNLNEKELEYIKSLNKEKLLAMEIIIEQVQLIFLIIQN